ncbi:MAG: hypothetical protein JNN05_02085, partial [Candidatus Omnitrophica bacterium]|nr:hypothetical protein [Candidatus Omnitrophota bacterium]
IIRYVQLAGVENSLEVLAHLYESYLNLNLKQIADISDMKFGEFLMDSPEVIVSGGYCGQCHSILFSGVVKNAYLAGVSRVIHLAKDAIYGQTIELRQENIERTWYFGSLKRPLLEYAIYENGRQILKNSNRPQIIVNMWETLPYQRPQLSLNQEGPSVSKSSSSSIDDDKDSYYLNAVEIEFDKAKENFSGLYRKYVDLVGGEDETLFLTDRILIRGCSHHVFEKSVVFQFAFKKIRNDQAEAIFEESREMYEQNKLIIESVRGLRSKHKSLFYGMEASDTKFDSRSRALDLDNARLLVNVKDRELFDRLLLMEDPSWYILEKMRDVNVVPIDSEFFRLTGERPENDWVENLSQFFTSKQLAIENPVKVQRLIALLMRIKFEFYIPEEKEFTDIFNSEELNQLAQEAVDNMIEMRQIFHHRSVYMFERIIEIAQSNPGASVYAAVGTLHAWDMIEMARRWKKSQGVSPTPGVEEVKGRKTSSSSTHKITTEVIHRLSDLNQPLVHDLLGKVDYFKTKRGRAPAFLGGKLWAAIRPSGDCEVLRQYASKVRSRLFPTESQAFQRYQGRDLEQLINNMSSSVTDDNLRVNEQDILSKAVRLDRERLIYLWHTVPSNPLGSLASNQCCLFSSEHISNHILKLAQQANRKVNILEHQTRKLLGSYRGHYFNVILFKDSGRSYIVDTTFIQFFKNGHNYGTTNMSLKEALERAGLVQEIVYLLWNGFVDVTDSTVALYSHALVQGTPGRNAINRDRFLIRSTAQKGNSKEVRERAERSVELNRIIYPQIKPENVSEYVQKAVESVGYKWPGPSSPVKSESRRPAGQNITGKYAGSSSVIRKSQYTQTKQIAGPGYFNFLKQYRFFETSRYIRHQERRIKSALLEKERKKRAQQEIDDHFRKKRITDDAV